MATIVEHPMGLELAYHWITVRYSLSYIINLVESGTASLQWVLPMRTCSVFRINNIRKYPKIALESGRNRERNKKQAMKQKGKNKLKWRFKRKETKWKDTPKSTIPFNWIIYSRSSTRGKNPTMLSNCNVLIRREN